MARPIWRGTLNFGLVTVPVEVYSATSDHSIHFRQFERGTTDRVRYRRVNERTGEEVAYSDIVKGYDLGHGDVVLIDPDELAKIAPGQSRTIDIDSFVDLDEIDPVYFEKSYWLTPSQSDFARPYELLIRAMSETGRVAVARFVMRGREHIAAIRAGDHLLHMDTLLFAADVRDPEQELSSLPQAPEVKQRELDMAIDLVESMSTQWQPGEYRDTYTERVEQLIEDKRAGRSVAEADEPAEPTKVVDLADALSASVRRHRDGGRRDGGRRDGRRHDGGRRSRDAAGRGRRREATGRNGGGGKEGEEDLARMSKAELSRRARELDVAGRSRMSRAELQQAVGEHAGAGSQRKAS